MPSVQLTLICCETLVEYCYVKELSTRRELCHLIEMSPVSHSRCRFIWRVRCSFSSNINASAYPRLCGIMIHRNVLASKRALDRTLKFSQRPLLFITKHHFFPRAFKACLCLSLSSFFLTYSSSFLFFSIIVHTKHWVYSLEKYRIRKLIFLLYM